jgi:hypothetical protein
MLMRIRSNNSERYPTGRMLVAAILLIIPAAQSSRSPQEHWANRSLISVSIDRENMPERGDQLVERAMRTWTTAADGGFTLRRTFIPREAGIRVFFNGAGGNYGETRPHVNRATGLIDEAEVAIAADAPYPGGPADARHHRLPHGTPRARTRTWPRAHGQLRRHHVSVP